MWKHCWILSDQALGIDSGPNDFRRLNKGFSCFKNLSDWTICSCFKKIPIFNLFKNKMRISSCIGSNFLKFPPCLLIKLKYQFESPTHLGLCNSRNILDPKWILFRWPIKIGVHTFTIYWKIGKSKMRSSVDQHYLLSKYTRQKRKKRPKFWKDFIKNSIALIHQWDLDLVCGYLYSNVCMTYTVLVFSICKL